MSTKKGRHQAVPTEDPDDITAEDQDDEKHTTSDQPKLDNIDKTITQKIKHKARVVQDKAGDVQNTLALNLRKKTLTIVYPVFGTIAIGCLLLMLLMGFDVLNDIIGFFIIFVISNIGSCVGMYGVYKWGAVEQSLDYFKTQNGKYEDNLVELKEIKNGLKIEVNKIDQTVCSLRDQTMELEETLKEFDKLRESLQEIAGENQDIAEMLDDLNGQCNELKILSRQKEKAQLVTAYYEVQLKAKEAQFTKKYYQRFIGRLNHATRDQYEKLGGFHAMDTNNDGTIDPAEFERMTEKVIQINDEALCVLTTPHAK